MTSDPPDQAPDEDGPELARAQLRALGTGSAAPRRRSPRAAPPKQQNRDPALVADEVDRLIGERGWEPELRTQSVFARWADLVGEEVAAHCRPQRLEEGRLDLTAESTAWATQLRLLAPALVRRLSQELGDGVVTSVRIAGPVPPRTRGRLRVRDGRGPGDTYG